MKKSTLPLKTFNLFWSYDIDTPFSEKLYKWITTVGKYVVIGVEMVVLSAFIARFILDQNVNDLTDKINENNQAIEGMRVDENKIKTVKAKIENSQDILNENPTKLIEEIPKIYSLAPASVKIKNITFAHSVDQGRSTEYILLSITGNPDETPKYKKDLEDKILNPDGNNPNNNIVFKEINVVANSDNSAEYTYKLISNL